VWASQQARSFSQFLNDLVNPGQRGTAPAQVVVAGVHVGLVFWVKAES
jgi:hypothetical protein